MTSKASVKFAEDIVKLALRAPDEEELELNGGSSCLLDQEVEDLTEDEIPWHPSMGEVPGVITCHLLLRLINDAITMLGYQCRKLRSFSLLIIIY